MSGGMVGKAGGMIGRERIVGEKMGVIKICRMTAIKIRAGWIGPRRNYEVGGKWRRCLVR